MLIREFAMDSGNKDAETLAAVSTLLAGRAEDETARKQMSINAFIELARQQGINVTQQNLSELISKEPLKNILEPLEPNSNVVRFKGNTETTTGMTVDQAQDVVDRNAKAAMKRGMKSA
jgi:hypothetical protein